MCGTEIKLKPKTIVTRTTRIPEPFVTFKTSHYLLKGAEII